MKNIILFILLGVFSTSCTQIQTQIQNANGQIYYQGVSSTPPSKISLSSPLKTISPKQKTPKISNTADYEVEIVRRKIQTYIVIQ